jgi:phosphatidylinositol-3-phosphatase
MKRLALIAALTVTALAPAAPTQAAARSSVPPVRHAFVVFLENENADVTFAPGSPAPYLSQTLPSRGAFIPGYYGITHLSLGNYTGFVSGQGSNPQIQADCQIFSEFVGGLIGPDGQALGNGCVFPPNVKTIADQLNARGLRWMGYMEDMGNDPTRESGLCGHPGLNTHDETQTASEEDQYAARHNPFVYFHSIIDDNYYCEQHVVPLTRLPADLSQAQKTPSLSFITPDLCHDGHDEPCANGEPGGLVSADAWLREWVPRITGSPAFKRDGLLLITFDEAEAEGSAPDASACCNQAQFPNTPNNGGPVPGRGGGRVGAVALSPFIRPGTVSSHNYNHFSALRSLEQLFGLPLLGYAASPDPGSFGTDVFSGRW